MSTKIQIIDPIQTKIADYKLLKWSNIPKILDNSCSGIYINLDFFQNRINTLTCILQKLRYNGELLIEGNDLLEIGRAICTAGLSITDVNELIYKTKLSISSVTDMIDILQQKSLIIIQKRVNHYQYFIKAQRIKP